jgi:hypothetical protein
MSAGVRGESVERTAKVKQQGHHRKENGWTWRNLVIKDTESS